MNKKIYDLVIVGGGASGMYTALVAAQGGTSVLIIEKNRRLGEKLRITGGGRCNITNAEFDLRTLLKNYGDAEKYLYSAFTEFGIKDTIDFFAKIGLKVKVEDRKRAFPVSERAEDVVNKLSDALKDANVEILTDSTVTKINSSKSTIFSVQCGDNVYKGRNYLLASGGTSRPETGATGDGFGWLKSLGHSIKNPSPSITPLAVKENWVKKVAGTSAKSATLSFYLNDKKYFKIDGDVLFTHFGVSGPTILSNAYKVAELLKKGRVTLRIDCLPNITENTLDEKIRTILHENGAKQVKNIIKDIAPVGLASLIKETLSGKIDLDTKSGEVSKSDRKIIVDSIKNMTLTIDKLMGLEKAVVADGGVSLKEIDTRSFRSLKIDNLYVTGDLLDIVRPSGGYSLQLCWTSGYVAAQDILSQKV